MRSTTRLCSSTPKLAQGFDKSPDLLCVARIMARDLEAAERKDQPSRGFRRSHAPGRMVNLGYSLQRTVARAARLWRACRGERRRPGPSKSFSPRHGELPDNSTDGDRRQMSRSARDQHRRRARSARHHRYKRWRDEVEAGEHRSPQAQRHASGAAEDGVIGAGQTFEFRKFYQSRSWLVSRRQFIERDEVRERRSFADACAAGGGGDRGSEPRLVDGQTQRTFKREGPRRLASRPAASSFCRPSAQARVGHQAGPKSSRRQRVSVREANPIHPARRAFVVPSPTPTFYDLLPFSSAGRQRARQAPRQDGAFFDIGDRARPREADRKHAVSVRSSTSNQSRRGPGLRISDLDLASALVVLSFLSSIRTTRARPGGAGPS